MYESRIHAFLLYHVEVKISMAREGIERNKLDYILTDLLPVELSGRFSYRPFYEFLMEKEHKEELDNIAEKIKELCAESNGRLFEHGWGTMPLRYIVVQLSRQKSKLFIMN